MSPKKNKVKGKYKDDTVDTMSDDSMHRVASLQKSQRTKCMKRGRAKKYSKAETNLLAKICHQYDPIIGKNSNSDAERKIKAKAWETIKGSFDARCRTEGIYVSIFTLLLHKLNMHMHACFNLS